MANQHPLADGGEKVVTLPAKIDIGNARAVGEDLVAAFDAGITVVIADLTGTSLCTAAGVHELALACERATARSVELRLAIPPGEALRVFTLTGHDRWLPVYPNVQAALAGPASADDSQQSVPLTMRMQPGRARKCQPRRGRSRALAATAVRAAGSGGSPSPLRRYSPRRSRRGQQPRTSP